MGKYTKIIIIALIVIAVILFLSYKYKDTNGTAKQIWESIFGASASIPLSTTTTTKPVVVTPSKPVVTKKFINQVNYTAGDILVIDEETTPLYKSMVLGPYNVAVFLKEGDRAIYQGKIGDWYKVVIIVGSTSTSYYMYKTAIVKKKV